MSQFLSLVVAFLLGAAFAWWLRRAKRPAPPVAAAAPAAASVAAVRDEDLDAAIIEYLSSNQVYHINDVCRAIEHPQGARYVRAHFHKLMEEGKIRYQNMVYTI